MAEILCIRHGQASFATADYDQLSETGYLQGKLLGQHLVKSGVRFDRIYAGTLKRQVQTAEAVTQVYREQGLETPEIEQDARWNELETELQVQVLAPRLKAENPAVGDLLKKVHHDKKALQKLIRATFDHWIATGETVTAETEEELESWSAAHGRVTQALAEVHTQNGSGTRVGIFSSGGIIAIIAAHVMGLPSSGVYPLFEKLINCSITRLIHNAESIALSTFNEHAYLQAIADSADQANVITYR